MGLLRTFPCHLPKKSSQMATQHPLWATCHCSSCSFSACFVLIYQCDLQNPNSFENSASLCKKVASTGKNPWKDFTLTVCNKTYFSMRLSSWNKAAYPQRVLCLEWMKEEGFQSPNVFLFHMAYSTLTQVILSSRSLCYEGKRQTIYWMWEVMKIHRILSISYSIEK